MSGDDINLSNNPFVPPQGERCPINDLPPELLDHIFSLGWVADRDHEDDDDDFEDVPSDSDSDTSSFVSSHSDGSGGDDPVRRQKAEERLLRRLPFNTLVSQICKRWRTAAVSNALLWNHIDFTGEPPFEKAYTYLERAKQSPLWIRINPDLDEDDDGNDRDDEPSSLGEIMETVLAHMDHCYSLFVNVSYYPQMHFVLRSLGMCPGAPLLEVLQLEHDDEGGGEHELFEHAALKVQDFVLFHGHAPRLHVVSLWGVHLPWARDKSPYLAGLTDFQLAYHAREVRPTFLEFAGILHASPDLRVLSLSTSGPSGDPAEWPKGMPNPAALPSPAADSPAAAAPLVLARLEELLLNCVDSARALALVQRLRLPALTSLALDFEDDDANAFMRYLGSPESVTSDSASASERAPGGGPPLPKKSVLAGLAALKLVEFHPDTDVALIEIVRDLAALEALNVDLQYGPEEAWLDVLALRPPRPGAAQVEGQREEGEVLLPRLTTLTIANGDYDVVREIVEGRIAAGVPLKRLLLEQDMLLQEEEEAWLREHVDVLEFFDNEEQTEAGIENEDHAFDDDVEFWVDMDDLDEDDDEDEEEEEEEEEDEDEADE
ncbi:uncharacterized protein BXZ73DRAFT_51327 [Epithele typhae]|uniref:uncharacterized protein n=1 Tax=Epithele typhae TaxID=378194 RepID=UPI002007FFA0|nr:uncharacterized protein BXZ73DRAFT_51327 [Epithele typhae]KAH9922794.1 hypothetical protein BXZ73DRAFT_51327 [Epithele typhae]